MLIEIIKLITVKKKERSKHKQRENKLNKYLKIRLDDTRQKNINNFPFHQNEWNLMRFHEVTLDFGHRYQ